MTVMPTATRVMPFPVALLDMQDRVWDLRFAILGLTRVPLLLRDPLLLF